MFTDNNLSRQAGRVPVIFLVLITQLLLIVPVQSKVPQARHRQGSTGSKGTNKSPVKTGGLQNYSARFDSDLFVEDPIQLRGVAVGTTLNFVRPRGWTIQSGTELQLQLSHSEALIPEMSFLTISVNSTPVKTISMDHTNVLTTSISVPIPPTLLKDYNRLQFSVAQHYTRDCEDPFHSALWVRIDKNSEIHFAYKQTPQQPDLSLFPAPFYDELHYGPVQFQYLMPQQIPLSTGTLKAMATVNATLAQSAGSHPMETTFINSLAEAKYPVIIVGTPDEQPAIKALTQGKSIGDAFVQVMISPGNPLVPLLIVTGPKSDDVMKAARVLASSNRRSFLNGQSAAIREAGEVSPSVSHDWHRGYLPDRNSFKLSDIGYQDQSVHGFFSHQISMNFKSIPDFIYQDHDQFVKIHYQYTGNLNTDLSTMEVKIDDIVVRAFPLTKRNGEQRWDTFEMPSRLIHANAMFRVVFHLFPIGWDPCKRVEDEELNATLFADTEFSLPKDHVIKLPDLEAFRNGGFPFTEYQDMSNLGIVLPEQPSLNDIQMLMNLTTRLGRMTKSERIAFEVYLGSVSPYARLHNNLIVLGTRVHQLLIGDPKQLPGLLGDTRLELNLAGNDGYIQEWISPWDPANTTSRGKEPKHVILVLTGNTERAMMNIGKVLLDDRLFLGNGADKGLAGNLILVEESGRLRIQRTEGVWRSTEIHY